MKNYQVGLKTLKVAVSLEELPENARNYVRRISELVGVRISTFSVGPDREQTNILESVWAYKRVKEDFMKNPSCRWWETNLRHRQV